MEYFMGLIEFIMWCVRGGLVVVIMFLPFIIPIVGWMMFMRKYDKELDTLRSTGAYKWQATEYSMFLDRVYKLKINDYFKEHNKKMYWVRKLAITVLTILFTFCLCDALQSKQELNSYNRELYAFEDNQGFYIRGRLMGSGSGSDELVYYYTLKSGNESFQSYRATANMSEIHYTTDEPYVKYTNEFSNTLDGKWHTKATRLLWPKNEKDFNSLVKVDFYVPNGAVQNNYNSDLK